MGTWLIKILFTVIFAFMFLTISTCWNPWLIPDSGWKWRIAYRDAMSFRASHYFVSFMSEAALIAAGFGCTVAGSQVLWHYTVTQPHNIEVPRSLVEVVVSWNLPMYRVFLVPHNGQVEEVGFHQPLGGGGDGHHQLVV